MIIYLCDNVAAASVQYRDSKVLRIASLQKNEQSTVSMEYILLLHRGKLS